MLRSRENHRENDQMKLESLSRFYIAFAFTACCSLFTWAQEDNVDETQLAELVKKVKALSKDDLKYGTPLPEDALATLESYDVEAIPKIAKLLGHENLEIRRRAAEWLELGYHEQPEQEAASKALEPAFMDESWVVRKQAFDSYQSMAELVPIHILQCIASLEDPHEEVASSAKYAICNMGKYALPAKDQLLEFLKGENAENEYLVILAIGKMGPKANDAIPVLLKLLDDTYDSEPVGESLGQLGARDELIKLLDEGHSERAAILQGLGRLPKTDEEVIKRLIDATQKKEEKFIRMAAIIALGYVRPATEDVSNSLVESLADSDENIVRDAVESLQNIEPKFNSAVDALIKASQSEVENIRGEATDALKLYEFDVATKTRVIIDKIIRDDNGDVWYEFDDSDNDEVVKALIDLAKNKSESEKVRATALWCAAIIVGTYEGMEKYQSSFQKLLSDFANDTDCPISIRCTAAINLEQEVDGYFEIIKDGIANSKTSYLKNEAIETVGYGTMDKAIPLVIEALSDKSPAVVQKACDTLQWFEEKSADAVPKLAELAEHHTDYYVRSAALSTIGEIGTNLDSAIPVLIKLLDRDTEMQSRSAKTVAELVSSTNVDRKQFVKPLIQLAKSEDSSDRYSALMAIGSLETAGTPAAETVIEGLDDPASHIRRAAVYAIGEIQYKNERTINRLGELLEDDDEDVQVEAMKSLATFKVHADKVLPRVTKFIEADRYIDPAFTVIGRYGEAAEPVFPLLEKLLNREQSHWRELSLKAIFAIGPPAKPLLPQIKKSFKDENFYLRIVAYQAALKIAPDDQQLVVQVISKLDPDELFYDAEELFADFEPEVIKSILNSVQDSDNKTAKANAKKLLKELNLEKD